MKILFCTNVHIHFKDRTFVVITLKNILCSNSDGKSYVCTAGYVRCKVSLSSDEGEIFVSHDYHDTYLEL